MVDAYFMSNGESPISGYSADGVTPIINEKSDYVEEGVLQQNTKEQTVPYMHRQEPE